MFDIKRFDGLTLRFSETMEGYASPKTELNYEEAYKEGRVGYAHPVKVDLVVTIEDLKKFFGNPEHEGTVTGTIDFSRDGGVGGLIEVENGRFKLFNKDLTGTRHLEYRFEWTNAYGVAHTFRGIKNIEDNPGFDSLDDITTLYIDITSDPNERGVNWKGIIYFDPKDFPELFGSIEVDSPNFMTQVMAKTAFFAFCAGEMLHTYTNDKVRSICL
jgi:cholesterol oxidase